MSTESPVLITFVGIVEQIFTSRYCTGVSLTLVLYDWLLLIGRESNAVWNTRWSWTKAVYYANRLISSIGLTINAIQLTDLWIKPSEPQFCRAYVWLMGFLQWSTGFGCNALLLLRVVALYHRHKLIKYLLYFVFFLSYFMTLGFILQGLVYVNSSIQYSAGLNLCIITVHPSFTLGAVVPPAFFDCVLFLLTLARAIRDARNKVISLTPKRGILSILYRDGVYYFTVLFAVHVWNVATYSMSSTGNFPSVYFAWSIMVVMSSRVYLNLIVAASGRSSDDEPTSYLPSTFEDNQRNAAGINPHNETEIIFAENTRSTDVPLTVFTVGVVVSSLFSLIYPLLAIGSQSAFSIETVVPTARGAPYEMPEEERNIVLGQPP